MHSQNQIHLCSIIFWITDLYQIDLSNRFMRSRILNLFQYLVQLSNLCEHYARNWFSPILSHAERNITLFYITCPPIITIIYIVLSQARAHLPILMVLWFLEVLCVTTYHAKFLWSESNSRFTELKYIAAIVLIHFRCHDIRNQKFVHTRPWSCCSVPCLQHEIRILQATTLQKLGHWAMSFLVYSFLHCRAALDKEWAALDKEWAALDKEWVALDKECAALDKEWVKWQRRFSTGANFASWVGNSAGIVDPFNHLLHAISHPQFLVFKLQAPVDICTGQYGE